MASFPTFPHPLFLIPFLFSYFPHSLPSPFPVTLIIGNSRFLSLHYYLFPSLPLFPSILTFSSLPYHFFLFLPLTFYISNNFFLLLFSLLTFFSPLIFSFKIPLISLSSRFPLVPLPHILSPLCHSPFFPSPLIHSLILNHFAGVTFPSLPSHLLSPLFPSFHLLPIFLFFILLCLPSFCHSFLLFALLPVFPSSFPTFLSSLPPFLPSLLPCFLLFPRLLFFLLPLISFCLFLPSSHTINSSPIKRFSSSPYSFISFVYYHHHHRLLYLPIFTHGTSNFPASSLLLFLPPPL